MRWGRLDARNSFHEPLNLLQFSETLLSPTLDVADCAVPVAASFLPHPDDERVRRVAKLITIDRSLLHLGADSIMLACHRPCHPCGVSTALPDGSQSGFQPSQQLPKGARLEALRELASPHAALGVRRERKGGE